MAKIQNRMIKPSDLQQRADPIGPAASRPICENDPIGPAVSRPVVANPQTGGQSSGTSGQSGSTQSTGQSGGGQGK